MSTTLIPLSEIPGKARDAERAWRKRFDSRSNALTAAEFKIVSAPGCHSRPYFDPPVIGWIGTVTAAEAYCGQLTHMPDGNSHYRARFEYTPNDVKFDH